MRGCSLVVLWLLALLLPVRCGSLEAEDSSVPVDEPETLLRWIRESGLEQQEHEDTPEYVQRFAASADPYPYELEVGARWHAWEKVADTDTVILTQTSPNRLLSLQRLWLTWGGPLSCAIFIPFPRGTAWANGCRSATLQWLDAHLPESPLLISFLFAADYDASISCRVDIGGRELFPAGAPLPGNWTVTARSAADPAFPPSLTLPVFLVTLYPVNALRNAAWAPLTTPTLTVLLIDVDFVTSSHLYQDLVTPGRPGHRMRQNLHQIRSRSLRRNLHLSHQWRGGRTAIVVPALQRVHTTDTGIDACRRSQPLGETPGGEAGGEKGSVGAFDEQRACLALTTDEGAPYYVPLEPAAALRMHSEGTVEDFQKVVYPRGHGCYWDDYGAGLLTSTQSVTVTYRAGCEPYVLVLNDPAVTPRYDARFGGRSFDKVAHLWTLKAAGFFFQTLPGHFAVHVPHSSTRHERAGYSRANSVKFNSNTVQGLLGKRLLTVARTRAGYTLGLGFLGNYSCGFDCSVPRPQLGF